MGVMRNPKYEKAVQSFVSGKTQKDAYEGAGFSYKSASCTRFFARKDIAGRIEEIITARNAKAAKVNEIATQKAGLDEAWIIERLKYLTEVSIRGQPVIDVSGEKTGKFTGKVDGSTAVACLRLASQIRGMLVHRHEVGDPGVFARLTEIELQETITKDMVALGVDPAMLDDLMAQAGFGEDTPTVGEA